MSQFSLTKEFNELVKSNLTEKQMIGNNGNSNNNNNNGQTKTKITAEDKWAKSTSFFQNNKDIKREKVGKQYTITHIKSRNFLSNVVVINKEDFYNENFVFNVFSLITKNLNRFYLDRRLSNQNKHEMIYIL